MPKGLVSLAVCVAACLAAIHDAGAMGFGRVRGAAVLGQPLDLAVALRLEEGESLPDGCVSAEVVSGEQRISPVEVRLEGSAGGERHIRISTRAAIDEPVVSITLTAGCASRMSLRFVAFADPPGATPSPVETAEPPLAAPPAPPVTARPAAPAPAAGPAPRAAARPAPAASPATSRTARRTPRTAAPPPPRATPRLQLEAAEPPPSVVVAAAPAAAQASAAQAAASAAEASALAANQRMLALEAELARMRADAQVQRDALLQMRSRVAERDLGSALLPWLLGLVLLLAALAVWLGLRTRRLAREREPWWGTQQQDSTHAGESAFDTRSALPSVHTTENAVFDRIPRPTVLATPPPAPIDTTPGALQTAVPIEGETVRHAVTVEEQIDLEQQADFFIVLGQDEAAIDLLLTHLRGTGGTSPMPYLKLLEIYRRRDDREAYERTRIRFNQRFNGVAPAWGADLAAGRALEDYPNVMQRLQQAWWSPLDAMAELEALLFRKGGEAELFDLPAYQEVLFLYLLARDLHLHEQERRDKPQSHVDVLLPIEDSTRGGLSVRIVDVERTSVLHPEVEAPEQLDIDLSQTMPLSPQESAPAAPAPQPRRDDRSLDVDDSTPPR
jgi:hypothetical protein